MGKQVWVYCALKSKGWADMLSGKKVTISDIARASGLSKTTVSRYINGKRHLMSEESCQLLERIIQEMDYHPSTIARSLKSKRSYIVGVVVADISSPWSSSVISGVGEVLFSNQYVPVFINSNNSIQQENTLLRALVEREIDGLIINATSDNNPYLVELAQEGLPIVLCDRVVDGYPFDISATENDGMLHHMLAHLKEQGYNRVAFFTEFYEHISPRKQRLEAYLRYAKEMEFSRNPEKDVYVFSDSEELEVQLSRFVESLVPGDVPAIFGVNSVTTVRALHAIMDMGLRVPQDMGICGPDDWNWDSGMNWSTASSVSITTMAIDSQSIGREAARMLLRRLNEVEVSAQSYYAPVTLIQRESTAGYVK